MTNAAAPANACPQFAPVMALDLEDIYHDPRASIPDVAAEQRNQEQLQPLTDFMRFIEQKLDDRRIDRDAAACAFAAFRAWAAAGALTRQAFVTYNREGTVTRNQDLIGLLIVALKFKKAGFVLDPPVIEWLAALTHQDLDFFEKATNRSNLYYWSGAAAALFAVVDRDRQALTYQEQVWRAAIRGIRDDGTIAGELARGQRALIYHIYAFSALLMLRAARESLGYPTSSAATEAMRRLANVIGRTLCNPEIMGKPLGATLEMPGDWAYRVPLGLGQAFLDDDWRRCGNPHADTRDIGFGGDTRATAAVLHATRSSTD